MISISVVSQEFSRLRSLTRRQLSPIFITRHQRRDWQVLAIIYVRTQSMPALFDSVPFSTTSDKEVQHRGH